jgi:hypothetical protein
LSPDLEALRDIHDGLGSPWWPLAPGWWLIGLALVAAFVLIRRYRSIAALLPPIPLIHVGDWRWDARRELHRLRRKRPGETTKTRLAALAELLKRIAMARHGRDACAGLHGEAWLEWLSAHDPDGFDWREHAQALIRVPYAPEPAVSAPAARVHQAEDRADDQAASRAANQADGQDQLERLIAAAERWVLVRPKPALARPRAVRTSSAAAVPVPVPAQAPAQARDPGTADSALIGRGRGQ